MSNITEITSTPGMFRFYHEDGSHTSYSPTGEGENTWRKQPSGVGEEQILSSQEVLDEIMAATKSFLGIKDNEAEESESNETAGSEAVAVGIAGDSDTED